MKINSQISKTFNTFLIKCVAQNMSNEDAILDGLLAISLSYPIDAGPLKTVLKEEESRALLGAVLTLP